MADIPVRRPSPDVTPELAADVESAFTREVHQEGSRTLSVHPVADLFPMLTADELKDLAADIKERGQLHPIVLDSEGRVLDGRNRLAACNLAGVEPRFETYDGDDPDGYALAVNLGRRHMTKGQKAMITVLDDRTYGRGANNSHLARVAQVDRKFIQSAQHVYDSARDLIDLVIAGTTPLNEAYKTAQGRKAAASTDEAKMAKLEAEDPDLAALVKEERISLDNAVRQHEDNKREHADHVKLVSNQIHDTVHYCTTALINADTRKEYAGMYDHSTVTAPHNEVTAKELRDAGNALLALAKEWSDKP